MIARGSLQLLSQPGIDNLQIGGCVSVEHDVLRSLRLGSVDASTDHDLIMAEQGVEHIGRLTDMDYGTAEGAKVRSLRNPRNCRRQLDKSIADSHRGGFGAIGDLQLGKEIGNVGLHGAGSDEEGIGDFAI